MFLVLTLVGGTALAYSIQIKDLQMQYVGTVLEYASQVLSSNTEYLDQSVLDRAWRVLTTAVRKPRTFEQYDTYASLATARGNYEQAAEYLQGCIDKYPGDDSTALAILWLRKGSLYTLSERMEDAMACYDRALELNGNLADAYLLRAQMKNELGQAEGAAEDLRTYQNLAGDHPVIQAALGSLYESISNYQNAVDCYTAAIESGTYEVSCLASRGRCRILLDDTDGAHEDLERFFNEGGQDETGDYYAMLGMCRMEAEDYTGAVEVFHEALSRDYQDPKILLSQCVVAAYVTGDYDTVIEDGMRALEISKSSGGSDSEMAELNQWIGFAYFIEEKFEEAAMCFESALEYDPELSLIPYYAGICFMSAGDNQKAAAFFEKSAERGEYISICLYNCALCRIQLGEYKAAERALKASIEANDDTEAVLEARELLPEVLAYLFMHPETANVPASE